MVGQAPGYESVMELDNIVYDEDPISSATTYSDPIHMGSRMFLNLDADFTIGSLTSVTLSIQIWNGAEWVDLYHADGAALWDVAWTGTAHRSMLVGDDATAKEIPVYILWNLVRVKVVAAGTLTSSVLKIRAAAK